MMTKPNQNFCWYCQINYATAMRYSKPICHACDDHEFRVLIPPHNLTNNEERARMWKLLLTMDEIQKEVEQSRQIRIPLIRVRRKTDGRSHIVGSDPHDFLEINNGKIKYYNLQNGEGTGEKGLYEFVGEDLGPMGKRIPFVSYDSLITD